MHSNNHAIVLKLIACGDANVGKTCLIKRLCFNEYNDGEHNTIGVDFLTHEIKINKQKIFLHIWDTAGQDKYNSIVRLYYRNAVAVLLVFAIDNAKSFDNLEKWYNDARQYSHPNAKVLLVCNKIDLIDSRAVSINRIEQFCKTRNIEYIETSAKNNSNVEAAFQLLVRKVLQGGATNEIQLVEMLEPTPKSSCC